MAGPAPPVENITITSRSMHWIRAICWPAYLKENFVELCRKHMIEKAELIGLYWRGAHGEI